MYFSQNNENDEIVLPPNYRGNAFRSENKNINEKIVETSVETNEKKSTESNLVNSILGGLDKEDLLLLVVLFLLYKENSDEDITLIIFLLLFVK